MRAASVIAALTTLAAIAAAGAGARSTATMTLSLRPAHPVVDSEATLTIRTTSDEGGIPFVIAVAGPTCPGRIPLSAHETGPDELSIGQGAFTRTVNVYVEPTTRRFCAYLQPANMYEGELQYTTTTAPLARAELVLDIGASGLRGTPSGGVSGGTRKGDSVVTLDFDRTGRRIVRVRTTCGGNPIHPGSLGKEFIGKRFSARVSLPLTPHITWSGLITPDNSHNYDAPVPAAWTKPTRFRLDVRVTLEDGLPRALIGTGTLSSAGLPCPALRRYVAP